MSTKLSRLISQLGLIGLMASSLPLAITTPAVAREHAPLGYQIMCLKTPQQCKGGGKAKVELSNQLLATLKRVNGHVNRTITPSSDKGGDVWSVGVTKGDCEDFVLAKRSALVRAGVPPSALRIAYVKTRRGEGHAILVVKSNGADLVLDNLTQTIRPLKETGYRVISISTSNPRVWI